MNKRKYEKARKVTARFRPETRFELDPIPVAPPRGVQETELELLKGRLLRDLLDEEPVTNLNASIRQAANDAAALAWTTAFPLLLFPALLEEKARLARVHARKQKQVVARSQELFSEAIV